MSEPTLPIVIDTRERAPWRFDGFTTKRGTLETGDYSIEGFESRVAIERKSKADAWGCVGGGRKRFERCMERLGGLESALVIIESSLDAYCIMPPQVAAAKRAGKPHVEPSTAVGSYVSWMCRYRVPVVWVPDRNHAERIAIRFLGAYLKYRVREGGV